MIRMEVVSDADTIAWDEQEETTTCTPPDHHKKNRWSCIPANKYSRGPSRWEKPTLSFSQRCSSRHGELFGSRLGCLRSFRIMPRLALVRGWPQEENSLPYSAASVCELFLGRHTRCTSPLTETGRRTALYSMRSHPILVTSKQSR